MNYQPLVVEKLLKLLPPLDRKEANELLNYPHNSAGRIMTPEYVDLRIDMTVAEAIEHIRKPVPTVKLYYIWALD